MIFGTLCGVYAPSLQSSAIDIIAGGNMPALPHNNVGQYLIEVLTIAVLAFGLSYFTSSAIAGQIGNCLLEQSWVGLIRRHR